MVFNWLGEIHHRPFEQQRYCASGPNFLAAAIILWNTVYLDHTITNLGSAVDPDLLRFLSPLLGTQQPHRRLHLDIRQPDIKSGLRVISLGE